MRVWRLPRIARRERPSSVRRALSRAFSPKPNVDESSNVTANVRKRDQFEHVIRAAADVTGEKDFVVIGSQAILGEAPGAYLLATLPAGWESRLRRIPIPGAEGACAHRLEMHDLAASKLAAHRDKDLHFVDGLIKRQLVRLEVLRDRVATMSVERERLDTVIRWLDAREPTTG